MPPSLRWSNLTAVVVLAVGTACPSPSGTTGSLALTVNGVVVGDVTVAGPNGYTENVAATRTLLDLAPGTYAITARAVSDGTLVSTVFEPTVDDATVEVEANTTASSVVAYTANPLSGRVWVAGLGNPELRAFTDAQLQDAGTVDPDRLRTVTNTYDGGVAQPQFLAFDRSDNLWASYLDPNGGGVNNGTQQLVAWSPAFLRDGGTGTPSIVIDSADAGSGNPSLDAPLAFAFDASGNLWVGNCGWVTGHASLVRFAAASLAASGAPVPDRYVAVAGCPEGMAFDATGNLWVLLNSTDSLLQFSSAELDSSSPTATTTIPIPAPHDYPTASAFDSHGTLWVAQCGTFTGVTGYPSAQLADAGAFPPAIQVTASVMTCPTGLAFDNAGNLWVQSYEASTTANLLRFTPSMLAASGTATPDIAIPLPGPDFGWGGLAFHATPTALPIRK